MLLMYAAVSIALITDLDTKKAQAKTSEQSQWLCIRGIYEYLVKVISISLPWPRT